MNTLSKIYEELKEKDQKRLLTKVLMQMDLETSEAGLMILLHMMQIKNIF